MRPQSKISSSWWDYTTLDPSIIRDAAKLTPADLLQLSRPGFTVTFYDTLEDFYLAEALEYIEAWRQATADNPVGICGPIGPTEQLPLVARLVNELEIDVSNAHFWGMDEWIGENGKEVSLNHPLSFERADRELCFNHIKSGFPESNLHFPAADTRRYIDSWNGKSSHHTNAGRSAGRFRVRTFPIFHANIGRYSRAEFLDATGQRGLLTRLPNVQYQRKLVTGLQVFFLA